MKTCSMNDFMQELTPWLAGDYIRQALVDDSGKLVLLFTDWVKNIYQLDDCSREQVHAILRDLKKKGVAVKE